jgi:hypothetical protein
VKYFYIQEALKEIGSYHHVSVWNSGGSFSLVTGTEPQTYLAILCGSLMVDVQRTKLNQDKDCF